MKLPMIMQRAAGLVPVVCLVGALTGRADFQGSTHMMPFDEEGLAYGQTPATGVVAQLQTRLDRGEASLAWDEAHGYLPALIQAFKLSTNSQVLVFSKTSFQRDRIGPHTPRAIFFNDDIYLGSVQNSSILEVSAVDPQLGGVFYTFENKRVDKPKFVRTDNCLECHASAKTMGVPGHLIRSFETDESGIVDLLTGVDTVSHRTPLKDRWGGWYVTGKSGPQGHRGNLLGREAFLRHEKEPGFGANKESLREYFDPKNFLTETSDIAALMVLEHQSHGHNFLTRVNYEATLQLKAYGHVNYLKSVTEAFVKYLFFVDEAPLTAPIVGSPAYRAWFEALGPKDSKGRSLRQFDLQTRMFKYPCSFLIYTPSWDALPKEARAKIYRRMWEVLSGDDTSEAYAKLTPDTRRAILEILAETKQGLPEYWHL